MTAQQEKTLGVAFWLFAAASVFFAVETTYVKSLSASWLYLKLCIGCLTIVAWIHEARFGKPMPRLERWTYRFAMVLINVLLWLIVWP